MEFDTIFSHRLQELIDYLGISKADFSRRTGVGKSNITRYLQGVCSPKDEIIRQIAQSCGISVDWLRGRTDDMHGESKEPSASIDEQLSRIKADFIQQVKEMPDEKVLKLKALIDLMNQ